MQPAIRFTPPRAYVIPGLPENNIRYGTGISLKGIFYVVAQQLDLEHAHYPQSRKRQYVMHRSWAGLLAKAVGFSFGEIGRFTGKDHSSVKYNVDQLMGQIQAYKSMQETLKQLLAIYRPHICIERQSSRKLKRFLKQFI